MGWGWGWGSGRGESEREATHLAAVGAAQAIDSGHEASDKEEQHRRHLQGSGGNQREPEGLRRIRRHLQEKGSEGIRVAQREAEGILWSQKDSEGIGGNQKDSEGTGGSQKDSEGTRWKQKEPGGLRRNQRGFPPSR